MKTSIFFTNLFTKAGRYLALFIFFSMAWFLSDAQLKADFNATTVAGCPPFVSLFNDLSIGNPTSWQWDLGNGATSNLQNPAAIYSTPGTYTVKLVVRNASGIDSLIKSQYITVYNSPIINFVGSPTSGCFPLNTQFTDQSTPGSGNLQKWEWDFGDGNISNLQNPDHVYTSLGNYNVSLKLTNSFGCASSITSTSYINISSGVKAQFTNSTPNSCQSPATINFLNSSTGTGALNYQWDFGDGSTSTSVSPSHIYNVGGSYTVRLIVISSIGCSDTLIKPDLITVGSTSANFSDSAAICVGVPHTIQNTSTPAPGSVFWDFGDGTFSDSINPSKTYANTGNYTIKMVANFGACIDSVSKAVTVLGTPQVNFSATPTVLCQAPLTVNFTDATPGGSTYFWDFGDGSTSNSQNPSHIYTTLGIYTVKSLVTNTAGCQSSLVKDSLVIIKSPVVSITGLPTGGCAPFTYTFTTKINSVDSIATFQWNFGDGNTSTAASPTNTYTTPGNYAVTLNYTTTGGCIGSVNVANGISAGVKPKANFSATPLNTCASQSVTFSDLSTGNPNQWLWLFGDGTSSTLQNPVHQYNDTGNFTVKLIAYNRDCGDTMTIANYIHIIPPVARFSYIKTCASPLHRVFTDNSIGANSWNWDFGDGSPKSTLQNPIHDYAIPGIYLVTLTIINQTTGCSSTRTNSVQVVNEIPGFTPSNSNVCKNSPVSFTATNNVPANILLYTWNFGDGNSISDSTNSIIHNYTNTGAYNVTLTLKDIFGCINSVTTPLAINVSGPTAVFRSSVPGACLNTSVNFIDSSYTNGLNSIQQWNWNWGDGTSQNFTSGPFNHTYSTSGIFPVTLKVTDNNGCTDSIKKPNAIIITKPVAGISGDSLSCTTHPVSLLNASTGQQLAYFWNLGDGTTSTQQNPVHLYNTEGNYTVSLNVKDLYGCVDSVTKINYVTIANPVANFTLNDSTINCPPLIGNFTNTSSNYFTSFWDFGDGATSTARNPSHFYTSVGIFTATLTVTGPGGCTSQKSIKITVLGPSTSFSYSNIIGCKPLSTTFEVQAKDKIKLIWDFDDGTSLRTPDSVIVHTYNTAGFYLPKLILLDTAGCSVLINGKDTIKVLGVKASFNNSGLIVCDSGSVQFTNTSVSNDIVTIFNWNFGDGSTSTQQNPAHLYTMPGIYNTTLNVITQQGCKDTISNPANVKVVKSPKISITGDVGSCVPAVMNFKGNIMVPDTSAITWNWDFANGNVSTLQNPPSQNYTTAGIFTVKAIVTNSSGCKDTANKIIDIYPLPALVISPDTTICLGNAASLSVSGAQSYSWSPSTFLSCTNCANPFSQATSSISYQVIGTSNRGCISTDSVSLIVKVPFKLSVSPGGPLCLGSSLQLVASGTEDYTWSPSTGLNNPSISSPVASPTISTTYQVVGSDSKGCFKDTGYVPINVFPLPVVKAGANQTINVGLQTIINPQISSDVTGVLWTPSTGIVSNNYPGITVKPNETTEYTIEVNNAVGCKASDKITIFVICNNSNVFVPNTFSPNGDGANDIFYPRGSGVFTIKNLKVFNRWGQVVFQKANFNANDASAGWDGTYNGKKLPADVYVYTLEVTCENNTTLVFKGNIALIK